MNLRTLAVVSLVLVASAIALFVLGDGAIPSGVAAGSSHASRSGHFTAPTTACAYVATRSAAPAKASAASTRISQEPGRSTVARVWSASVRLTTVRGTVHDATGRPFPHASIVGHAERRHGWWAGRTIGSSVSTKADALGRFALAIPSGELLRVAAESPGYVCAHGGATIDELARELQSWIEPPSDQDPCVELVLVRPATLSGIVRAATDGRPLQAEASIGAGLAVHANAEGCFEIGGLAEGVSELSVSALGFATRRLEVVVSEEHGGHIDVALARACSLQGRVHGPLADRVKRVTSVRVYVEGGSQIGEAKTDEEGRFSIDGLEPGRVEVVPVFFLGGYDSKCPEDSYREYDFNGQLVGRATAELTPDRPALVDLALHAGARVEGHLRDATGAPCLGWYLRCVWRPSPSGIGTEWTDAVTGDGGAFSLSNLREGLYDLAVEKRDGNWATGVPGIPIAQGVAVGGGATTLDLVLPEGGTIAGHVSFPDGSPSEGYVDVYGPAGSALFHCRGGAFEVPWLPSGWYRVEAREDSDRRLFVAARRVDVTAGGHADVSLRLHDPATLNGRVLDADGKPQGGVELVLTRLGLNGRTWEASSCASSGRFAFQCLDDGVYRLDVVENSLRLVATRRGVSSATCLPISIQVEDGAIGDVEVVIR
jgi:hypothetical protein